MTYEEARKFVTNAARKGSILGLDSITALMEELGNVQEHLKIVHIAGTNGKGSTLAYLLAILQSAGYRTGRYNSPAVFDYLEIFSINGKSISEENYAKYMEMVMQACERLEKKGMDRPTAFEIETAMAYIYFYYEKCEIVLIETGMGGDEDATNVVRNTLLSLISPISLDHMQFLGNTITEIAGHKAGIIKDNSAVITAMQKKEVLEVIRQCAEKKNAYFGICGTPKHVRYDSGGENETEKLTSFDYEGADVRIADIRAAYDSADNGEMMRGLQTRLNGAFQPYNACLAIAAALYLAQKGFTITGQDIRTGVKNAKWGGRFEKLRDTPLIYFDGGHNPGAAVFIRKSIEIYFTNKRIVYIIGVLADKDYDSVLRETAALADYIVTITPDNPRALDGKLLKEAVMKYHTRVTYADSIEEALKHATAKAGTDGVVFIFGSLSYLLEIKQSVINI